MRAIQPLAAIVLLAIVAAPGAAQVRYKDDEGIVHFVNSIDEVPDKYKAGAVGGPVPKVKPAAPGAVDWEQKAREVDRQRQRDAQQAEQADRTAARASRAKQAECEARARVWERSLPKDSMVSKYDMAAALGPDCDVDAMLARRLENLKTGIAAQEAATEECKRRLAASGADQRKIYTANMLDARERKEAWIEVARAIGNPCADVLMFGRP